MSKAVPKDFSQSLVPNCTNIFLQVGIVDIPVQETVKHSPRTHLHVQQVIMLSEIPRDHPHRKRYPLHVAGSASATAKAPTGKPQGIRRFPRCAKQDLKTASKHLEIVSSSRVRSFCSSNCRRAHSMSAASRSDSRPSCELSVTASRPKSQCRLKFQVAVNLLSQHHLLASMHPYPHTDTNSDHDDDRDDGDDDDDDEIVTMMHLSIAHERQPIMVSTG